MYAQTRQATRGAVTGERHGGARGQQINNFGQPWKKFRGKHRLGGDGKGDPLSRNQGKTEKKSGYSGFLDGDGRHPVGRLNL